VNAHEEKAGMGRVGSRVSVSDRCLTRF